MQGCLPSHLIFLRLHSSQALVTRLLFCTGIARLESSFDAFPSSCSALTELGPGLSSADCWSSGCSEPKIESLPEAGSGEGSWSVISAETVIVLEIIVSTGRCAIEHTAELNKATCNQITLRATRALSRPQMVSRIQNQPVPATDCPLLSRQTARAHIVSDPDCNAGRCIGAAQGESNDFGSCLRVQSAVRIRKLSDRWTTRSWSDAAKNVETTLLGT